MIFELAYYLTFNTIFVITFFLITNKLFRLTTHINYINIINYKIFLSFILFILFYAFTISNQLMDILQNSLFVNTGFTQLIYSNGNSNLLYLNTSSTSLLKTYYYPFIYVFLIVTGLSITFCLTYNYDELYSFMLYCSLILIAGFIMFCTDSILIFFFSYEMLLLPSFFILYKFAKTKKCTEAAYLMFFWTQFGALFLILGLLYITLTTNTILFSQLITTFYSKTEVNFLFLCFLFGFGVKLPIWPFYGWLPKAHVEASTNFSIFLSGVLVKFAFFGLFKLLLSVHLEPTCYLVLPFLLVGIVDSVLKLFYQTDLKKLVAYSTVVEMHWLTICIISGHSHLLLSGFCMLISHALLSTNSFLLVDAITRRFKTRLINEVSGLNFMCPKLFLMTLLNTIIFLGFPGSLFFVSEFLFFTFIVDMFPLLTIFLLIFLYLLGPSFFFRSWMNVMFGSSNFLLKHLPIDLTTREIIIFLPITILLFVLGMCWQSFII